MTKTCSFCSAQAKFLFKSKDYNRRITSEYFDHYRCQRCGLIFISPIPDDLGIYYPQEYHAIPETTELLDQGAFHEQYKIDIIKRFVKQGRLLEIGPSIGCFVYLAQKSGYAAEAIEMDPHCSRFLNEVAGVPTLNSNDITAALFRMDSFDVITMWHVIEHVTNPWEVLTALGNRLNPGGIAVIAAPNPESFQFKTLSRYWPHLDAPRHLFLIPARILESRMQDLGMEVVLRTTCDEGGLGWNQFGWEYFFSNLNSKRFMNKRLKRLGRIVSRMLSPIERLEGQGSAYTMVFRKVA